MRKNSAVAFVLLLYIVLASLKTHLPGLQYDEMLFANAALGGLDHTFITSQKFGMPIMLMPYIGALKAYLYAPIFAVFGVSAASVRIPMILLSATSLVLLFLWVKKLTGRFLLAFAVIVAVATDPSFISFTRTDVGPNALEFFLKMGLMYCVGEWKDKRKTWAFLGILGSSILGIYNKINFIWTVNALLASGALIYARHILQFPKRTKIYLFLGFSVVYLFFGGLYIKFNSSEKFPIQSVLSGIPSKTQGIISVLQHEWFSHYLGLKGSLLPQGPIFAFEVSCIFIGLFFALKNERSGAKTYLFILSLLLFHLIQIYATTRATSGWHFFTLYPFFTLLFVMGLHTIVKNIRLPNLQYVFYAGVFCIVFFQTYSYLWYVEAFELPMKNAAWSPAIYELAKFTQHSEYIFVSTDWGIHNQLLALSGKKGKFIELWPSFALDSMDNPTRQWFATTFFNPKEHYAFITKSDEAIEFKKTKEHLLEFSELLHAPLEKVQDISYQNSVVYEIYTLKK